MALYWLSCLVSFRFVLFDIIIVYLMIVFAILFIRQVDTGRVMLPNVTFLEAYNCDGSEAPRPGWADRARKQLYRADYVLNHFVHYSTVTKGYITTYKEQGNSWKRYFAETTERVTDEIQEATMIHTKDIDFSSTKSWKSRCRGDFKKKWQGCNVGIPWPNNTKVVEGGAHDDGNGIEYNCFLNNKVEDYWIPRLEQAIAKRKATIPSR
jgi:hypothetical protein